MGPARRGVLPAGRLHRTGRPLAATTAGNHPLPVRRARAADHPGLRAYQADPPVLRRAKALAHILASMTIYVGPAR